MPIVDPIWIEFQISTLKLVLFLLAWYSGEVGYSIVWYSLNLMEILVFALQLIVYSGYPSYHTDSWGSPFAIPSLLLAHLAAMLTYIFMYHWWWRKETWKPSTSTVLYTLILIGMGAYWCLLVPIWWYQIVVSLLFGVGYAMLTSLLIDWFFIPLLIDYFITAFNNTMFINILGNKNTILTTSRRGRVTTTA